MRWCGQRLRERDPTGGAKPRYRQMDIRYIWAREEEGHKNEKKEKGGWDEEERLN